VKSLRPETRVLAVIAAAVAMLGVLVVVIFATAGPVGSAIPPAVIVDTATPIPTAQEGPAAGRAGSTVPSPGAAGSAAETVTPGMLQAVSGPAANEPAVASLLGLPTGPNPTPKASTASPSARPSPAPAATPGPQVDVAPTASPTETPSPTESSITAGTPAPAATPAPDGATSAPDATSPTSTPEPTGD
jgi:hypothetical protein